MDINKLKIIANQKELTPKELAILNLWNKTKSEDSTEIFSRTELNQLFESLKGYQSNEYKEWMNLIIRAQYYDRGIFTFYNQSIGLIGELEKFYCGIAQDIKDLVIKNYKKERVFFQRQNYSLLLNKQVTFNELGKTIGSSFNFFFASLIGTLICQYYLSNAFDESNDLYLGKSLQGINNALNNYPGKNNLVGIPIQTSIEIFKENFNSTIVQVCDLFEKDFSICSNIKDETNQINRYVKTKINKYLPSLFNDLKQEEIFDGQLN